MKTADLNRINDLLSHQMHALEQTAEVIKEFKESGIQRADLTMDDIATAEQLGEKITQYYGAAAKMAKSLVKKAEAKAKEEKAKEAEEEKAKKAEEEKAKKAEKKAKELATKKEEPSPVKDDEGDDDLSFLE